MYNQEPALPKTGFDALIVSSTEEVTKIEECEIEDDLNNAKETLDNVKKSEFLNNDISPKVTNATSREITNHRFNREASYNFNTLDGAALDELFGIDDVFELEPVILSIDSDLPPLFKQPSRKKYPSKGHYIGKSFKPDSYLSFQKYYLANDSAYNCYLRTSKKREANRNSRRLIKESQHRLQKIRSVYDSVKKWSATTSKPTSNEDCSGQRIRQRAATLRSECGSFVSSRLPSIRVYTSHSRIDECILDSGVSWQEQVANLLFVGVPKKEQVAGKDYHDAQRILKSRSVDGDNGQFS